MNRIACAALFSIATTLVGCSAGNNGQVRLDASHQAFTQRFATGVADVQDAGDSDLVFSAETPSQAEGSVAAVRQTLHVRVLWQQGFKVKQQMQLVSQNAVLRWYVIPLATPQQPHPSALVEYEGAGLVTTKVDGDRISLTIEKASFAATAVVGDMRDPIGPATLSGTLQARRDKQAAVAALSDLQANSAFARTRSIGDATASAR